MKEAFTALGFMAVVAGLIYIAYTLYMVGYTGSNIFQ